MLGGGVGNLWAVLAQAIEMFGFVLAQRWRWRDSKGKQRLEGNPNLSKFSYARQMIGALSH